MSATRIAPDLHQVTTETAAALVGAVAAGQPVTTKLVLACVADALRDEQTVAQLLRRSMQGENAFADLVRAIIHDEAEQIALVAIAGRSAA